MAMSAYEFTYDEGRRRGWCSCGNWTVYDVTRGDFERAAKRHRAAHQIRERDDAPALPPSAKRFEQTLADIESLPTIYKED